MLIVLSKFLVLPFYPLGAVLTLLGAGIVLSLIIKRPRAANMLYCIAAVVLFMFSFPPTAHVLMRGLEKQYQPSSGFKPACAVVLLGGGTVPRIAPRIYDETNHNGDRISHAARVLRQSDSPHIIVTGGRIEFMGEAQGAESESAFRLLTELFDVDSSIVMLEKKSRNTRENAVYVKELMEQEGLEKNIILVTSAYHMPRSVAIFRKLGFTVEPAPTGYNQPDRLDRKLYSLFPDASSLFKSTIAVHEYYGIIIYRILGWI